MADEIKVATEMLTKKGIKMQVYNEALNQLSRLEIDCAAMEELHVKHPKDKDFADDLEKTKKRLETWRTIVKVAETQLLAEKEELVN